MAMIIRTHFCFGIPTEEDRRAPVVYDFDAYPIKTRFRFRNDDFARFYMKDASGIREFLPELRDGAWHVRLDLEQGANQR